jgi:hypothetical protein
MLLKEKQRKIYKVSEDEEEYVSSFYMDLREQDYNEM